MRAIVRLLAGLLIVVLGACVPTQTTVVPPEGRDAASASLERAEALYNRQEVERALEEYRGVVRDHPGHPLAPVALMKIGAVHRQRGEWPAARQAYRRLLADYPQSEFHADARFELLVADFYEKRYEAVIQGAIRLLETAATADQRRKVNLLLGDAYLALKSGADALYYYEQAAGDGGVSDDPRSRERLEAAVAQLASPEIIALLPQATDPLAGYLLFQLARNGAAEGRYADAQDAVRQLVERFPGHPQAAAARDMAREWQVPSKILLGALLPLSGRYQTFGARALRGVEMALNAYTDANPASPVQVLIRDTGGDDEQSRRSVQELAAAGTTALMGPLVTAPAAAAAAQGLGVPIVVWSQKEGVTEAGEAVFRHFITPRMQVEALTAHLVDTLGLRRFAVLYPDERYGRTFMNLFWDAVLARGGTIVGVERYAGDQTDFAVPIKKLVGLYYPVPGDLSETVAWLDAQDLARYAPQNPLEASTEGFSASIQQLTGALAAGPSAGAEDADDPRPKVDFDAVFIPDAPDAAGLIVPQLAFYDIENVLLAGTNLWHSPRLIDMARDYVQGALVPDVFFAASADPMVRAFVTDFESTFGTAPGFLEALAYDTAMLLFDAAVTAARGDRDRLGAFLRQGRTFVGVTGETRFEPGGENRKRLTILTVAGDSFVEVSGATGSPVPLAP